MLPITHYSTAPVIKLRRSILADSVLASTLGAEDLERVEALGEIVAAPPGTVVFEGGASPEHLYVVLAGTLVPAGAPSFWVGPGDLCGEVGFALGSPRGTTMVAHGPDVVLWRVHRSVLSHLALPRGIVATRLLGAIARTVAARLSTPRADADTWTEADYCDHQHPAVTAMAAGLARRTPEQTAWAVWSALCKMPYRFDSWQWTASETIARGHGMCISKAILQVALMRALGVECGYVHGALDGGLVRACLPRAYAPRFLQATFEHYHAAARLGGRWVSLDASFSNGALSLVAETSQCLPDPYAVVAHTDLADVMRQTATYDAKNADAMNVALDRAQRYQPPARPYVTAMHQALSNGSTVSARKLVMDGLAADVAELRRCEATRGFWGTL